MSWQAGLRPVLIPSRENDPPERVRFGDAMLLTVPGHGAAIEFEHDNVYMAIGLPPAAARSASCLAGTGGAGVIRLAAPGSRSCTVGARGRANRHPAPSGLSIWRPSLDMLYGDHEGGQRTIARFDMSEWPEVEGERAVVVRYWNVDRDDPR